MKNEIFIEIDRSKIKRIAYTYVALGVFFFTLVFFIATFLSDGLQNILIGAGSLILILMLIVAAGVYRSLRNKKAGILINSKGIFDGSISISIKEIKWKQIKEFKVDNENQVVFVFVNKPEEIIQSAENKAIQRLLTRNLELYKTPVIIETKYLSIQANELFDNFVTYQKQFGK